MSKASVWVVCLVVLAVVSAGCASNRGLHSSKERKMTVGLVQREIRVGMSGAAVATVLGSPNIVTRESSGGESWIYDKISTESSYKESSGGVSGSASAAGVAGDALLMGTAGAHYSGGKGASATTQKTLTVVIRFDANSAVESVSYHSSTF